MDVGQSGDDLMGSLHLCLPNLFLSGELNVQEQVYGDQGSVGSARAKVTPRMRESVSMTAGARVFRARALTLPVHGRQRMLGLVIVPPPLCQEDRDLFGGTSLGGTLVQLDGVVAASVGGGRHDGWVADGEGG